MQKIVSVLSRHKWLTVIVGLILLYLLFAYFAINPIAKRAVPWVAEKYLGSNATVESVKFDPLRLKTNIRQFKLTRKSGDHLFGFDHVLIDLEASGILDWAWQFKEIKITKPVVNVAFSQKGALNWSELMQAVSGSEQPKENNTSIPRVILNHIAIINGQVDYEDANRPTPVQSSLSPIDLSLDGFSTLPNDSGVYHISAVLPEQSGEIDWTGDLTATPLVSNGQLHLKHIVLPKVLDLIPGLNLPFTSKQGFIDLNLDYDFSLIKNPTIAQDDSDQYSHVKAPKKPPTINLTLNNVGLQLHDLTANYQSASELSSKLFAVNAPNITLKIDGATELTLASLSAKVDDMTFRPLNGDDQPPLFSLPHIGVNEVAFNLADNQLKIGEILLTQGVVHAVKDQAGLLNWQAAFDSQQAKPVPNDLMQSVTSDSDAEATTTMITPAPAVAETDGVQSSEIEAQAPSAVTPEKAFKLAIANIKFNHWQADFNDASYVNPLTFNINDINIGLAVNLNEQGIVIDQLNTALNKITAESTLNQQPVATLKEIKLDNARIDIKSRTVALNAIVASQLRTKVIYDKAKKINWQSILKTRPLTQQKGTAKSQAPSDNGNNENAPWTVSLNKLALQQASIHIEDQTPAVPLQLDIQQGAIEINNISQNLKKALPVKLGFKVKQGGVFNVRGKVNPSPLKTDLKLSLNDFALIPFAPYINQVALLKLNDGAASINGRLKLKQAKTLSGHFKGGFSVNDLAVVEEANDAPFLAWSRVSSDDVSLALGPNALTVGHLTLLKPTSKFIIYEDKTMNVTRMLRSEQGKNSPVSAPMPVAKPTLASSQTNTAASNSLIARQEQKVNANVPKKVVIASKPNATAFPINIETINIEDAELEFADLSLRPQFGAHMNTLSGVINSLSTDATTVAKVDLAGKVNEFGTAKINGSLKAFNAADMTDMKLAFTNLDMHKLTPYSGKFAGRRIDSGKMSVDLAYKIKQHQLAGENKFVINKLKLGEKIDSKDAADLPLDLAIAILEDNDGIIDLDLPISGDLDDPQFKMSGIVWKAFKNVMTKVVTAPFKALGSLFSGKADDLESISFEAGNIALQPPEQEKLKALSSALSKRRGLSLTITPHYVAMSDRRALQEEMTRERVLKAAGLTSKVGETARPIDLENEVVQAAVKSLHDDLTNKSLFKKLGDKINKPEAGFYQKALTDLIADTKVTDADLARLATQRGEAIQQYLLAANIDQSRLILNKAQASKEAKVIKASLAIGVNKPVAKKE